MNKLHVVKDIVFLPKRFYAEKNVSIYSLLEESGYLNLYNQINEEEIFEFLIQCPDCAKHWLRWSEDKRTNSGWYFKQNENGKYIVEYFPLNQTLPAIEYVDLAKACAAFIKREIEEIRKN